MILGVVLLAVSPLLPWFRFYSPSTGNGLGDIGPNSIAVAAVIWVAASIVLCCVLFGSNELARMVALAVGAVIAAVAGALILAGEVLAALIPTWVIPESVRRAAVDVSPGVGVWLALIGAAAILGAAAGYRLKRPLADLTRSLDEGERRQLIAALGLSAGAALLLGWLRYQPWLRGSAGDYSFQLTGWALPWVGPLSMMATALLIAAVVTVMLGNLTPAVLCTGLGAWLFSFLAAITILSGTVFGLVPDDLTLSELIARTSLQLPEEVADQAVLHSTVAARVAWGAWLTWIGGLVAAAGAIWAMSLKPSTRDPKGAAA